MTHVTMATTLLDQLPPSLPQPSPFIKWVGGKGQLLSSYADLFPTDFNRYFEPFVGGGAVFFHLQPDDARLTDINPRLVGCYRAMRDELDELVELLEVHRQRHDKVYYYRMRSRLNAPRGMSEVQRAAAFIYLNKTCFNGLYRENKRGEFNVPMGSYKNPSVYDLGKLIASSRALQGVELATGSYAKVLEHAEAGDFVYFDPPYVPLNATSSFTNYAKGGFDLKMQIDLAQTFATLARRGCYVMLSNSDCEFVRTLFAGWRIETVEARRNVNSKSSARGKVNEVAVLSW